MQAHQITSRYRFVVAAILFLTYAAFGLSWIAVTPLLGELQREFRVGPTAVSLLNAAVSFAKVVAPLATGLFAARVGLKRAILAGSACIACAAGAALSPGFAGFVAGRFVFGLGGAVVVTLLGPMVMQWFPPGERPLANAVNNVAVNTGVAVTLFTTGPLAARLGWRGALLAYAALSVLLAVAWAIAGRERPVAVAAVAAAGCAPRARFREVWRRRETWLIAIAFAAPLALYLAFNTWLPRYYMEARGLDRAAASRWAGLFNLVGIPAAVAGGVLTRRLGLRRPFLVAAGFGLSASAFAMIYARASNSIFVAAVVLGICLFIAGAALVTTAMELPGVTPDHVTLIMGTMFSVAYVVSSASPLVVGWLRERTGSFVPGLGLWAALSSLLALAGLLLPETGPRANRYFDAIASNRIDARASNV